ncbi:MAG TPA: UPF0158 family protein [Gemmatimonadales bacterium]|nr:UPF0158 family protein [Gemmatimonadales bacterium]
MLRINAMDLVSAFCMSEEGVSNWLDLDSGEVLLVAAYGDAEDYPDEPKVEDLENSTRHLFVPPVSSDEAFDWMVRFAENVADGRVSRELLDSLQKRRPFRSFKDVLLNFPPEREAWFEFQRVRLAEAAEGWLEAQGIAAELVWPEQPKAVELRLMK